MTIICKIDRRTRNKYTNMLFFCRIRVYLMADRFMLHLIQMISYSHSHVMNHAIRQKFPASYHHIAYVDFIALVFIPNDGSQTCKNLEWKCENNKYSEILHSKSDEWLKIYSYKFQLPSLFYKYIYRHDSNGNNNNNLLKSKTNRAIRKINKYSRHPNFRETQCPASSSSSSFQWVSSVSFFRISSHSFIVSIHSFVLHPQYIVPIKIIYTLHTHNQFPGRNEFVHRVGQIAASTAT